VTLSTQRVGLPGKENMIIGSAFLPAPAQRQEGGASSRLARESGGKEGMACGKKCGTTKKAPKKGTKKK
jgi:hypothetical protein